MVQGSNLSSFLYDVYTNEIPMLNKTMGSDFLSKITNEPHNKGFNNISRKKANVTQDSASSSSQISLLVASYGLLCLVSTDVTHY